MAFSNNTVNSTVVMCSLDKSEGISTILKTVAYTTISLTALLGNTLVLAVFRKSRDIRSVVFYFIVNMAVSDLIFPLFALPRIIGEIFNGPFTWIINGTFGSLTCKMATFLQDISTAVSIESLVVIALERFVSVVYAERKSFLSAAKTRRTVISITWIMAILFHIPYLIVFKVETLSGKHYCMAQWGSDIKWSRIIPVIYFVSIFTVLYAIPFLVIVVLYSAIVHKLRHLKMPGRNGSTRRRRRQERNRTVTLMALMFVVVFFLCWTPFFVFAFMFCFKWHFDLPCSQLNFRFIVILVAHLNSAINPFIYLFCSKTFRKGVRTVLPFCFGQIK